MQVTPRVTHLGALVIAATGGVSALAVWSGAAMAPSTAGEASYEFAAEYADVERGVSDLGQRWYDPAYQTFYSSDPAPLLYPAALVSDPALSGSYTLNHLNSYLYADPDGLMPRRKKGATDPSNSSNSSSSASNSSNSRLGRMRARLHRFAFSVHSAVTDLIAPTTATTTRRTYTDDEMRVMLEGAGIFQLASQGKQNWSIEVDAEEIHPLPEVWLNRHTVVQNWANGMDPALRRMIHRQTPLDLGSLEDATEALHTFGTPDEIARYAQAALADDELMHELPSAPTDDAGLPAPDLQ